MSERPKIAGPWRETADGQWTREDLRFPGDWAFGVWQSYDPTTGDPTKPATWTLRWWWCKHRTTGGHVDTQEQAMAAADAYGRANGWSLQDEAPPVQQTPPTPSDTLPR